MRLAPFVLAAALTLSCRAKPENLNAPDRSEEVDAQKAEAPPGSQELGAVEVTDGGGCGALGVTGSYPGALSALRNKAARMGANYVKITEAVEPHEVPGCYDKGYVLRGVAYRAPARGGPAAPVADAGAPCVVDAGVEAGAVGMCKEGP